MMTGRDLLDQLDTVFPGGVTRHFQFPLTRLEIVSDTFKGLDDDDREQALTTAIGISTGALRDLCNRLFFRFDLRTPDEPSNIQADRGYFWLRTLVEQTPRPDPVEFTPPLVVHFYGYKGGQARSSSLCFLARALAREGWRVLAVDVDAEAPSLDVLFNVRAPDMESSLLGIRANLTVTPVRAVTPKTGNGFVDLLPFRPWEQRFDLDAAALAMEGNIHPPGLTRLIQGTAKLATNYDITLVDHRTGLASTVPPWVQQLPGPIVVFARMDGQWHLAKPHLRALWSLRPEQPGLLVSFKPDDEPLVGYLRRVMGQSSELLTELAASMSTPEMSDEDVPTADDVADHWVVWPYDTAFNKISVPDVDDVSGTVREAVVEVRRLLRISARPTSAPNAPKLHPSGALDEGDLIQTQALRDLSARNNPFTFILGRKGTGKTRLLRALVDRNLGEALLVPNDDKGRTGVTASNTTLVELINKTTEEPERFWWTLLRAALDIEHTSRAELLASVQNAAPNPSKNLKLARAAVDRSDRKRVFLVDGLETAFPRAHTFDFIGALFRVVSSIDSDPNFNGKVRIRVFVRTDLAERGFENLEQQSHGRTLRLSWNTQTILNFALSRIGNLQWFAKNFSDVRKEIEKRRQEVLEGSVPDEDCDALLLRVFPERLRRLNLNMTTFLRTYFSDDPTGKSSYYPRIFDEFLRVIAGVSEERKSFVGAELAEDRVSDELIYFAHEKATASFLVQVRAELLNLVDLNENQLTRLIDAFRNTITPFRADKRSEELAKVTGLSKVKIRQALERMKTLGIFEDRPKYPGQWRAGRLFKTSLGMLYDRKRK